MKKYLPFVIFFLAFFGTMTFMFVNDFVNKEKISDEVLFSSSKFVANDGELFELKNIKAPVIIIHFWATWCPKCTVEMPLLEKLKSKFNDHELIVITVKTDDGKFDQSNFSLPVVQDKDDYISDLFEVKGLPTTFIYANKKLHKRILGLYDFESKETELEISKLINLL